MNLLLVIPPSPEHKRIIRLIDCSHETKANYLWQPNDFMIITSRLGPDDKALFIDGTCDLLSEREFFAGLASLHGDLLIFALSSVCWESDLRYYRKTRELFPGVPAFVIGDIFLEDHYRDVILDECDGIIFHPYRLDLAAMAVWKKENRNPLPGVCTASGQEVLGPGKQPTPVSTNVIRHELFLKPGYRFPFARHKKFATVTTMWGCPFACSYCTDSKIPPAVRPPEEILRELESVRQLGVQELFFADKTFGFYRATGDPLLKEMAKRFRFSWSCYFHPQTYRPELLDAMYAAGCHTIIIGIDSVNVGLLKQYNRSVSREKVEETVKHVNKLPGMSVCADFIIGLEHETRDDIMETLEYAMSLTLDFASFNIAAPLPGSDIRKKAVSRGMLLPGKEGYDTSGCTKVLGNDMVNGSELIKIRQRANLQFYVRPSLIWKRLRKTSSWEHFSIQFSEMLWLLKKL